MTDRLYAAITAWLANATAATGRRRAVAVDGEALRRTRHSTTDGQAAHLLAATEPGTPTSPPPAGRRACSAVRPLAILGLSPS